MTANRSISREELLAQWGWVRRLARALVHDMALADDVTQETMRIALARREGESLSGGTLRGWLRAVVRNLVRDVFRAERGRKAREQCVARSEAEPGTYEIVERSAMQQRIVHVVMQLDEPYRSTLLYRYLDDLSTAQVAKRMNTTEPTVRKRLSRGLEQVRATLDRDTKSWVLALIGTPRSTIPGALLVGTNLKLITAGLIVTATVGGWFVWQETGGSHAPRSRRATRQAAVDTAQGDDAARPSRDEVNGGAVSAASEGVAAPDVQEDVTLLRVRVETEQGVAVKSGQITCWWDTHARVEHQGTRRLLEAEITDEETELRLPVRAQEALVLASAPDRPPAAAVRVERLRHASGHELARGTVVHDVRVVMSAPIGGAHVSGVVFVDGVRRVPRGFLALAESPSLIARINELTATYQVGPLDAHERLWVTSDETVPVQLDLPEGDALDLKLTTERSLVLTVLNQDTDQPLAQLDLQYDASVVTERAFQRVVYRDHNAMVTTDEAGQCTIRGLPRDGYVYVRREFELVPTSLRMKDGSTMDNVFQAPEPVWSLRLTADLPAKLEYTIKIPAVERHATVFGYLAPDVRDGDAAQVTAKEIADTVYPHDPHVLEVDAQGRWHLDAKVPSEHEVWIERGRQRISEAVRVSVTRAGEVGPIALPLLLGSTVSVRLVNVPASGTVDLSAQEQRVELALEGREIIHTFKLSQATQIAVSCSGGEGGDSELSSFRQTVDVDPATQREVVIDLRGSEARVVTLAVNGTSVTQHGVLCLMDCGANGEIGTHQRVLVEMQDGRAKRPAIVPAGRYFYVFQAADRSSGLIAGVIDVRAGDVSIDMPGVTMAADAVSHGLVFTEIDGLSLTMLPAAFRTVKGDGKPSVVPASAKWAN